jgi:hypothetical protein
MLTKLEEANMISQDVTAKRSGKPRSAVKLRDEFDKRLSAYASSAIAAGVTLLAITKPADAKIVYTPAHIPIPSNSTVPLDLTHDGRADFSFKNSYYGEGEGYGWFGLGIEAANSRNGVWGKGQGGTFLFDRFASNLPAGRTVGPSKSYFQSRSGGAAAFLASINGSIAYQYHNSQTGGQWPYARGRYLGLRFVIAGKIHYGWARLSVPSITLKNGINAITAVVTGYAYETMPGKPIITGKTKGPDVVTLQPATLGHLATGASAIPAWRVKQTAATSH